MIDQPTLVDVPVAAKPLTPKQQQAYDYICAASAGVTTNDLGAHMHHLKGKHPAARPCDFCRSEGQSLVTSRALAPILRYSNVDGRRVYRARNPQPRERVPVREPTEAELARDPFAGL